MYTGGMPIKGYTVQYLPSGESDWNKAREFTWPYGKWKMLIFLLKDTYVVFREDNLTQNDAYHMIKI